MYRYFLPITLASFFILLIEGCCSSSSKNDDLCSQTHAVQATYYYQTAAENAALYYQGFNIAKIRIDEIANKKLEKRPAVVLDIDETVIDNSFFQVESIQKNLAFSDKRWNAWVKTEVAKPVPGAVDFVKYAIEKGVEVIFITNRTENLREATIRNMEAIGFPVLSANNYIFKTDVSNKTERRDVVSKEFDIQLLIGDNLSDFSDIFDNRTVRNGFDAVDENKDNFGLKYIILPNPTYGDWQKSALIVKDSCAGTVMVNRLRTE